MSKKKKRRKGAWKQYIGIVFMLAAGAVCGYLMMWYIDTQTSGSEGIGASLMRIALLFVSMYVAMYLQIVIHEAVKGEDGTRDQEIEIFYRFVGKIE